MKTTLHWLKRYLQTTADLNTIISTLNRVGLVVDDVKDMGAALQPFVIAEIKEVARHPDADRLSVCQVFDGQKTLQIVCGAPNVRPGLKVVLGHVGATVPRDGFVLKAAKIRGVDSQGMMCSVSELCLGGDHSGIMELTADAPVGQPFAAAYGYDDALIDIDVPPNRGDCLGAMGIARELSISGIGTLQIPPVKVSETAGITPVKVTIDPATKAYGQWRRLTGLKNGASPAWMQHLLQMVGAKAISAAVDVTNFICFDQGQPLHAFDAAKVQGDIQVRFAKAGEVLEALNGETYKLTPEMVIIADNAGPIALAGVIGGQRTACDESTTEVILECAYFDPIMVARAGRVLSIITDARYRFERQVDAHGIAGKMTQATALLQELTTAQAGPLTTAGVLPNPPASFVFYPRMLETLGGIVVPVAEVERILTAGGCRLEAHANGGITVTPPTWRQDLAIPQDIVEEVLHFVGYDAIPVVKPVRTPVVATQDLPPLFVAQTYVRQLLAQQGLHEAVTWSFLRPSYAAVTGGVQPDIVLSNPISAELAVMRPSLVANLVEAVAENYRRGYKSMGIFEVGAQYHDTMPQGQTMVAAGIRSGMVGAAHWAMKARSVDVLDAKADVWQVLQAFGIDTDKVQVSTEGIPAWYHPGRAGVVRQGPQRVLAYFGEIHPQVRQVIDCDPVVVGFEIMLENLPPVKWARDRKPWQVSPFQPLERDFSFVVPVSQPANTVVQAIQKVDPVLIKQVDIFDVYQMNNAHVALGIRLRIEPQDKTLTETDLQALSEKVIEAVTKTGATLRT